MAEARGRRSPGQGAAPWPHGSWEGCLDNSHLTHMDRQNIVPKTKLASRLQLGPENTEVPHMVERKYIIHEQAFSIQGDSSALPPSTEKNATLLRTAVYRKNTEMKHKVVKEGKMDFESVLSRKHEDGKDIIACQAIEVAESKTLMDQKRSMTKMISLGLKNEMGKKLSRIPVCKGINYVTGTSAACTRHAEGKYSKQVLKC